MVRLGLRKLNGQVLDVDIDESLTIKDLRNTLLEQNNVSGKIYNKDNDIAKHLIYFSKHQIQSINGKSMSQPSSSSNGVELQNDQQLASIGLKQGDQLTLIETKVKKHKSRHSDQLTQGKDVTQVKLNNQDPSLQLLPKQNLQGKVQSDQAQEKSQNDKFQNIKLKRRNTQSSQLNSQDLANQSEFIDLYENLDNQYSNLPNITSDAQNTQINEKHMQNGTTIRHNTQQVNKFQNETQKDVSKPSIQQTINENANSTQAKNTQLQAQQHTYNGYYYSKEDSAKEKNVEENQKQQNKDDVLESNQKQGKDVIKQSDFSAHQRLQNNKQSINWRFQSRGSEQNLQAQNKDQNQTNNQNQEDKSAQDDEQLQIDNDIDKIYSQFQQHQWEDTKKLPRIQKTVGQLFSEKQIQQLLSLKLSPDLQTKFMVFTAVNIMCTFMQRVYIQPTWMNVSQALQMILGGVIKITKKDVIDLALLAPDTIILQSVSQARHHEYKEVSEDDESFIIQLLDPGRQFIPPMMLQQLQEGFLDNVNQQSQEIQATKQAWDQDSNVNNVQNSNNKNGQINEAVKKQKFTQSTHKQISQDKCEQQKTNKESIHYEDNNTCNTVQDIGTQNDNTEKFKQNYLDPFQSKGSSVSKSFLERFAPQGIIRNGYNRRQVTFRLELACIVLQMHNLYLLEHSYYDWIGKIERKLGISTEQQQDQQKEIVQSTIINQDENKQPHDEVPLNDLTNGWQEVSKLQNNQQHPDDVVVQNQTSQEQNGKHQERQSNSISEQMEDNQINSITQDKSDSLKEKIHERVEATCIDQNQDNGTLNSKQKTRKFRTRRQDDVQDQLQAQNHQNGNKRGRRNCQRMDGKQKIRDIQCNEQKGQGEEQGRQEQQNQNGNDRLNTESSNQQLNKQDQSDGLENGKGPKTKSIKRKTSQQIQKILLNQSDFLTNSDFHPNFNYEQLELSQVLHCVKIFGCGIQTYLNGFQKPGSAIEASKPQYTVARPPSLLKNKSKCQDYSTLKAPQFLEHLRTLSWYQDQIQHVEYINGRLAKQSHVKQLNLQQSTLQALKSRNIQQLFNHQVKAIQGVQSGKNAVIATSTASGKSFCYNIPLLEMLQLDPKSCALYIFPTKALAQDQLQNLSSLLKDAFSDDTISETKYENVNLDIYDGDTPQFKRQEIRGTVQILITNPDMIHISMLPLHNQFERFFRNLKLIVCDEGHAYKGVFGCHAALLFRRLRRICERVYDSHPQFVVTSATIGNPLDHVQRLIGQDYSNDANKPNRQLFAENSQSNKNREWVLVDQDCSPQGPKQFVFWNPPLMMDMQENQKKKRNPRITKKQIRHNKQMNTNNQQSELDSNPQEEKLTRHEQEWLRRSMRQSHYDKYTYNELIERQSHKQSKSNQDPKIEVLNDSDQNTNGENLNDLIRSGKRWQLASNLRSEIIKQSQNNNQKDGKMSNDSQNQNEDNRICSQNKQANKQQISVDNTADSGQQLAGKNCLFDFSNNDDLRNISNNNDQGRVNEQDLHEQQTNTLNIRGRTGYKRIKHQKFQSINGVPQTNKQPQNKDYSRIRDSEHLPQSKDYQEKFEKRPLKVRDGAALLQNFTDKKGENLKQNEHEMQNSDIQKRLPGADWQARFGTAGTLANDRRNSPIVEMSLILSECVQHGLRTIAFANTRKLCELVTAYSRETLLGCGKPELAQEIKVYRAGYNAMERREIEKDLFKGTLKGVAATSALELGVDVGDLDATLHLGFPGSISSMRQQSGRAGRRGQSSLAIYLGFEGPLDQHFMNNPQELIQKSVENIQIDYANPQIMMQHLCCAALELPLVEDVDLRYFSHTLKEVLGQMLWCGLLSRNPQNKEQFIYVGSYDQPAHQVSLRAIDPERFKVVNEVTGEVIEEIEESKAFYQIYDGAVYMYQGHTYLCKKLDLAAKTAFVKLLKLKYFTTLRDYTDIHVLGGQVAYPTKPQEQDPKPQTNPNQNPNQNPTSTYIHSPSPISNLNDTPVIIQDLQSPATQAQVELSDKKIQKQKINQYQSNLNQLDRRNSQWENDLQQLDTIDVSELQSPRSNTINAQASSVVQSLNNDLEIIEVNSTNNNNNKNKVSNQQKLMEDIQNKKSSQIKDQSPYVSYDSTIKGEGNLYSESDQAVKGIRRPKRKIKQEQDMYQHAIVKNFASKASKLNQGSALLQSPNGVKLMIKDLQQIPGKLVQPPQEQVKTYNNTSTQSGACLVTKRFMGYRKVWQGSNICFDQVDLFLPDIQYKTQACYLRVPDSARIECREKNLELRAGIHAASHLIMSAFRLYFFCGPTDLGTECDNPYDVRYRPVRLLIYDKHPGGIGIANAAAPYFPKCMEKGYEILKQCTCTSNRGCPSCIQHLDCSEYNVVLDKSAAEIILRHTIQMEQKYYVHMTSD